MKAKLVNPDTPETTLQDMKVGDVAIVKSQSEYAGNLVTRINNTRTEFMVIGAVCASGSNGIDGWSSQATTKVRILKPGDKIEITF